MIDALRRTRRRLAALVFGAIVTPIVALVATSVAIGADVPIAGSRSIEVNEIVTDDGRTVLHTVEERRTPTELYLVGAALVPAAAVVAWFLSGLAMRPVLAAHARQRRLVDDAEHDLRTPITVLRTNAALHRGESDAGLLASALERSDLAAERMQATVDDLVIAARGGTEEEMVVVALGDVARRSAKTFAPVADARTVVLGLDVAQPGPAILGNPSALARAVDNLVDNAIRATPTGGRVTIVVGADPVELAVIDTGPGVSPDDVDRGRGMSIARQVAEVHGGRLIVERRSTEPGARVALRFDRG